MVLSNRFCIEKLCLRYFLKISPISCRHNVFNYLRTGLIELVLSIAVCLKLLSLSLRPAGRLEKRYESTRNCTYCQCGSVVTERVSNENTENSGKICQRGYAGGYVAGTHGSGRDSSVSHSG